MSDAGPYTLAFKGEKERLEAEVRTLRAALQRYERGLKKLATYKATAGTRGLSVVHMRSIAAGVLAGEAQHSREGA